MVLPAFNAQEHIHNSMDSLLAQTHSQFEIIAVDDGSNDGTAAILREYATRDQRVRPVILNKNKGVAEAFNTGIEASKGQFIARMDADDFAQPKRLAKQAHHLRNSPHTGLVACRVAFGGCREVCAGYARHVDWTNTLLSHEAIANGRFIDQPIANPSVMFRRTLVDLHGGARQGDFPEDYEMWLRWLDQGVRMEKIPEPLLVWNDPPQRATRTDPRYDPEAFYRVKAVFLARWLKRNNAHHPRIVVIGSGRVTRRRVELLMAQGVTVDSYVDIDPKKIGNIIGGIPVISRADMPGPNECFVVPFVASIGARQDISAFLHQQGFVEGKNYIHAA